MQDRPFEVIGNRLRELRERAGFSVQDISRVLGVSISYITQLERGQKSPTQLMSFALSELYKTMVTEIDPDIDWEGLPGFEKRELK